MAEHDDQEEKGIEIAPPEDAIPEEFKERELTPEELRDLQYEQAHTGHDGYSFPPEPYREELIPKDERNWVPDYGDQVIPRGKGFVTDFVYYTRGYMTPTLACIWSALWLLSTVIKREAWVEWHPTGLFANLFVVIIGAAGRAKKTTVVTHVGLPILRAFRSFIRDRNLYEMKEIGIIKDMTSPEALIDSMLPEKKPGDDFYPRDEKGEYYRNPDGSVFVYRKTSETGIIVSELSTFLSTRSYTDSMASLMLDLYDCHLDWDVKTLARGKKTLRRMYTTFLAGTTVDGLRSAVPKAAKGDGFLSRTTMVYVPSSKRMYPVPHAAKGAPNQTEMAKRLAYIAEHTVGEYKLSDEAMDEYQIWYKWFYHQMEDNPAIEGAISRLDTTLLKTAFLIRASRYGGPEKTIELQDLQDAISLIDATYASFPLLMSQLDEDSIINHTARVEMMIERHKEISRKRLLIYSKLRTDVLHVVLGELAARGVVEFEFNGRVLANSTGKPEETIRWTGVPDDGEGDAERTRPSPSFSYTEGVRDYQKISKSAWSKPHGLAPVDDGKPDRKAPKAKEANKRRRQTIKEKKAQKRGIGKVDRGESRAEAS